MGVGPPASKCPPLPVALRAAKGAERTSVPSDAILARCTPPSLPSSLPLSILANISQPEDKPQLRGSESKARTQGIHNTINTGHFNIFLGVTTFFICFYYQRKYLWLTRAHVLRFYKIFSDFSILFFTSFPPKGEVCVCVCVCVCNNNNNIIVIVIVMWGGNVPGRI